MSLPKIVVFGDSITWGSFDVERGGWCNRLQAIFMKRNEDQDDFVTVINCGISGDRAGDVLARFDSETQARESRWEEPVVIVVAIGINDANHGDEPPTPIELFERQYLELIQKAKASADLVIAIEPTNVVDGGDYDNASIATLVQSIREICASESVGLIPVFGLLAQEHLDPDLIHPNAAGHELLASTIEPYFSNAVADFN